MFGLTAFNDYTILKSIGKGSYGDVYLVQSPLQEKFAIKLIAIDQNTKEQSRNQARMYISSDHPNILTARQFFFFNKETYLVIVLEYCPDGNLLNFIGKLNQDQCLKILTQITKGVVYLHDKKIIHRDIKPENILMKDGSPKICDLGIAKKMKTGGAGTKVGTQCYFSPELLTDEFYYISTDIWSLGITFLQLLIGKRITDLFKGARIPAQREGFPSQEFLSQIQDINLRELIKGMLDRDPKTRLTAREVLRELESYKQMISTVNLEKKSLNKQDFTEINESLTGKPLKLSSDSKKTSKVLSQDQSLEKISPQISPLRKQKSQKSREQAINQKKQIQIRLQKKSSKIDEREQFEDMTEKQFINLIIEDRVFPNLTHIKLKGCSITDASLKTVAAIQMASNKLPLLEWLDLDSNEITDEGLRALASSARYLKNLKKIGLSNNKIGDDGIKALSEVSHELKNLQFIGLKDNKITAVGFKAFASTANELINLQWISIQKNKVTIPQMNQIKQQYKLKFKIFC